VRCPPAGRPHQPRRRHAPCPRVPRPALAAAARGIKVHSRLLKQLTKATAPALIEAFGIGPDVATELLLAAGDNTDRIRSESAFAKLCGACPIPASSGKTNRHRLNRGGNRQANSALYRTVIVRMRWHEPTIAYVARRSAEGLSKREIIRCLKRYLAREVFLLLPAPVVPSKRVQAA
jgi:transposase